MKKYKIHYLHLNEEPFKKIANGSKVFELRLRDPKRSSINMGDIISFTSLADESSKIVSVVKSLHIFPSFEELYRFMPLELCGYEADEVSLASPDDMLAYYSKDDILRYGVIAIEIEVQEVLGARSSA